MGVSEMDGRIVESEKWVIALRNPLKPIFTKSSMDKKKEAEKEYCSTTPTSEESRIPNRLSCPPPPKKRKPSSSRCRRRDVREFFNPPDLETIFMPRVDSTTTTAHLNY